MSRGNWLPLLFFAILFGAVLFIGAGQSGSQWATLGTAIGPAISVVVALVFSYIYPQGQAKRQVALTLIQMYMSVDMAAARRGAWKNWRDSTFRDQFSRYIGTREPANGRHEEFQELQRVMDFFVLVDNCLGADVADEALVVATTKYYWNSWSRVWQEIVVAVKNARSAAPDEMREPMDALPRWAETDGMTNVVRAFGGLK